MRTPFCENERQRDDGFKPCPSHRTGWLNASTAYQRLSVSRQLLQQANQELDLSQTRYQLGLASIVELSQAQLQQTQAQIGSAQAAYQYRLALAVLNFQTANF
ncbi:MAG TPA: TolC family protein [Terriglobales bacterium]|nr:TolC family protein [Terriglobales bacterium]